MSITIDAADKILLQQVVEEKSPKGAVPESSWIYKSFDKYQGQVQYKVVNPETTTQYVVPDSMKALHKFLVYLVSNPPYILTWERPSCYYVNFTCQIMDLEANFP